MSYLQLLAGMSLAGTLAVRFTSAGSSLWRRIWIPTSPEQLARSEEKIFSVGGVQYEQKFVRIGDHEISTIICNPPQSGSGGGKLRAAEEPPLVLLHGWGGAAGMWMRNLPELAAAGNRRVIAIDMLGCGRSSRPAFTQNGVHETEEWWIESVERWRHAMQIDRMQLCGHSLGGYIAAGYGLKYPARLERLILASPAGVPEPDAAEQEQRRQSRISGSFGRRMLMKFADACWSNHVTVMDIVRWAGPCGKGLVRWGIRKRFSRLGPEEAEALSEYIFHNWAGEACGERGLFHIFDPWVLPKRPLEHRLADLPQHLRVLALYGEHDWMQKRPCVELAATKMPNLQVVTLPNCGHQLFIENPEDFNASVLAFSTAEQ